MTFEELCNNSDWSEVFGETSGYASNTDNIPNTCPPGAAIDTSPVLRSNVADIIYSDDGDNDGDEWIGVFFMNDGRYLLATGLCDYTGWDCQSGHHLEVATSLQDIVRFGLSDARRRRLGISL